MWGREIASQSAKSQKLALQVSLPMSCVELSSSTECFVGIWPYILFIHKRASRAGCRNMLMMLMFEVPLMLISLALEKCKMYFKTGNCRVRLLIFTTKPKVKFIELSAHTHTHTHMVLSSSCSYLKKRKTEKSEPSHAYFFINFGLEFSGN